MVLTLAAFLLPSNAMADEAWAEYKSRTLTFKYGEEIPYDEEGVTVYKLNEGSNAPEWSDCAYDVTSVVFDPSFANARPTTCYKWFSEILSMESIEGLEYLNTEEVTDMSYMFENCTLTSLDLSNFNTAKVTNMSYMFQCCSVEGSLDLSSLNTAKVTNMSYMFHDCMVEGLDLSSFNTAKVTNMSYMFSGCTLKSLDLSSFNTAKVTNMSYMFSDCTNLTTIFVKQFVVNDGINTEDMFSRCIALVGAESCAEGSVFDGTMANYETGYFKTYYRIGDTKHDLCGETLSVDKLELEDGKDFVVLAPFKTTNASYSRTMTSNWGTLCLPFAVETASNADSKFYALSSVNSDLITLTQLDGTIAAGTPVLVYSNNGLNISASNVDVVTEPAEGAQANGWQLVGSFAETEVPDDGYIISKSKFWLTSDLKANTSVKAVKTKGLRAWLKNGSEASEARATSLSIFAEEDMDEETAINAVEALTEGTAEIYDVQGRRTDRLQKGLNIVKVGSVTKKVMVK